MSDIQIFEEEDKIYLAKHREYPLFFIDSSSMSYVSTTEKTKQKHIREVLDDEDLLEDIVDITGIDKSGLTTSLKNEEPLILTKKTNCPYRKHVGPKVFKACGGYDHILSATTAAWAVEGFLLGVPLAVLPSIWLGYAGDPFSFLAGILAVTLIFSLQGAYQGMQNRSKKMNNEPFFDLF